MLKPGAGKGSTRSQHLGSIFELEGEAHSLADRLPDLLVEAIRVASTVAHGIHGRRRPGLGETFWQFRQFQTGDAATQIDWRRSASSDHLYVREREWEAAHTLWLWPDLSPSMDFRSELAVTRKSDRALVLTLALAELLVRGGERVALLGLSRPTASRKATTKLAEILAEHAETPALKESLPPAERLSRFSGVLLFSDFLDPLEKIGERLTYLASDGVTGYMVQVLDPAEETLPYKGRTEFLGMEGGERWLADRVETLRPEYQKRLRAHRAGLEEVAHRLGWSFLVHHTDRPAAEPLLKLIMRLQDSGHDYRWTSSSAANSGAAG
ncbi:MAG: DUF58 domain-containing protein [Proteobacteria bacterium]|nr:MAG: DUF58 domain-containing protein [Pseudomonadota bacterium]